MQMNTVDIKKKKIKCTADLLDWSSSKILTSKFWLKSDPGSRILRQSQCSNYRFVNQNNWLNHNAQIYRFVNQNNWLKYLGELQPKRSAAPLILKSEGRFASDLQSRLQVVLWLWYYLNSWQMLKHVSGSLSSINIMYTTQKKVKDIKYP